MTDLRPYSAGCLQTSPKKSGSKIMGCDYERNFRFGETEPARGRASVLLSRIVPLMFCLRDLRVRLSSEKLFTNTFQKILACYNRPFIPECCNCSQVQLVHSYWLTSVLRGPTVPLT